MDWSSENRRDTNIVLHLDLSKFWNGNAKSMWRRGARLPCLCVTLDGPHTGSHYGSPWFIQKEVKDGLIVHAGGEMGEMYSPTSMLNCQVVKRNETVVKR